MNGKEALEKLKDIRFTESVADIGGYSLRTVEIGKDYKKECAVIEKELNERDDNKRILDIIKKKKVNIQWLITDTLNSYNNRVKHYYPFDMQTLTETEFNLIKEWLENEIH